MCLAILPNCTLYLLSYIPVSCREVVCFIIATYPALVVTALYLIVQNSGHQSSLRVKGNIWTCHIQRNKKGFELEMQSGFTWCGLHEVLKSSFQMNATKNAQWESHSKVKPSRHLHHHGCTKKKKLLGCICLVIGSLWVHIPIVSSSCLPVESISKTTNSTRMPACVCGAHLYGLVFLFLKKTTGWLKHRKLREFPFNWRSTSVDPHYSSLWL